MYESLYRKYRPKTFDDVVGQPFITDTLKAQIHSGRIGHAYLFAGTRGTGKTTCARILAKAVNCEHPVNGNPCNCCSSCVGIDNGTILDVVEIDAASNTGVDNVRELRDEAIYAPTAVKSRVYIIDEVHMLSKNAFNALLKILEEPPEHLMFILATTELNKVLPTILSRCQRYSFRRLDHKIISGRLKYVAQLEGLSLSEDAAELLGHLADGAMRDGLSLLEQCAVSNNITVDSVIQSMGLAGTTYIRDLIEFISKKDCERAISLFGRMWEEGKEPFSILSDISAMMRDALILRVAPNNGKELVSGSFSEVLLTGLSMDSGRLFQCLKIIQTYLSHMADSLNRRLQCELCLIELCGAVSSTKAVVSMPASIVEDSEKINLTDNNVEKVELPAPASEISAPDNYVDTGIAAPDAEQVQSTDELWAQALVRLKSKLNVSTYPVVSDRNRIAFNLKDDLISLVASSSFYVSRINKPDVLDCISREVSDLLGRQLRIRVECGDSETTVPKTDAKLERLRKFDNVIFN